MRLDAVVCGVGSGGTLTGLSRFFAARRAARRDGAGRSGRLDPGRLHPAPANWATAGSWLVEGIGEDFLPPIADLSRVRHGLFDPRRRKPGHRARAAASKKGILAGSSSGTLVAAALRYCREQSQPKRVVTLRLRLGQQVSVEDVQRLLDGRSGLAVAAPRSATCAI